VTDEIAKTSEADETAMRSIAGAISEAATTASEHRTQVKQAAGEAGPQGA